MNFGQRPQVMIETSTYSYLLLFLTGEHERINIDYIESNATL